MLCAAALHGGQCESARAVAAAGGGWGRGQGDDGDNFYLVYSGD